MLACSSKKKHQIPPSALLEAIRYVRRKIVQPLISYYALRLWSMHPTPGVNPACSSLRVASMASLILMWMILQKILLGTESSVTPRQFVHCVLFPFLSIPVALLFFRC